MPIVRARIRDVCCVPAAACAEAGSAPSDALRNGGPRRGFLRFLKFLSFLRFEREEPQELQELQEPDGVLVFPAWGHTHVESEWIEPPRVFA